MKPEVGKWYWILKDYYIGQDLFRVKCLAVSDDGKWIIHRSWFHCVPELSCNIIAEAEPPSRTWWQWMWGIKP